MDVTNQTLDVMADAIAASAPSLNRSQCVNAAKAAVRALRDPPPELFDTAFPGMLYTGYAKADWQDVVDAILNSNQSVNVVRPSAGAR